MRRKSWLTKHKPPSHALMPSASESIVSMSKWFVGSSKSSMCGFRCARYAKTTRDFKPSDSLRMAIDWFLPVMPKRPMMERILVTSVTCTSCQCET